MKDEILGKALNTDETVIPRYDIVKPDGTKLAEDAELILKNPVTQEGTPYNKLNVLTDETVEKVWPDSDERPEDPNVDNALEKLSEPVFKVGDILTTVRTNLGDDWLLCNGDVIDEEMYPKLAKISTALPIGGSSTFIATVPNPETQLINATTTSSTMTKSGNQRLLLLVESSSGTKKLFCSNKRYEWQYNNQEFYFEKELNLPTVPTSGKLYSIKSVYPFTFLIGRSTSTGNNNCWYIKNEYALETLNDPLQWGLLTFPGSVVDVSEYKGFAVVLYLNSNNYLHCAFLSSSYDDNSNLSLTTSFETTINKTDFVSSGYGSASISLDYDGVRTDHDLYITSKEASHFCFNKIRIDNIYDPNPVVTTLYNSTGGYTTSTYFSPPCILRDGRVLCLRAVSENRVKKIIYDPNTGKIEEEWLPYEYYTPENNLTVKSGDYASREGFVISSSGGTLIIDMSGDIFPSTYMDGCYVYANGFYKIGNAVSDIGGYRIEKFLKSTPIISTEGAYSYIKGR